MASNIRKAMRYFECMGIFPYKLVGNNPKSYISGLLVFIHFLVGNIAASSELVYQVGGYSRHHSINVFVIILQICCSLGLTYGSLIKGLQKGNSMLKFMRAIENFESKMDNSFSYRRPKKTNLCVAACLLTSTAIYWTKSPRSNHFDTFLLGCWIFSKLYMCGAVVIYISCVTFVKTCFKNLRCALNTSTDHKHIRHLLLIYNLLINAGEQLNDYFGFQMLSVMMYGFVTCVGPAFFAIQGMYLTRTTAGSPQIVESPLYCVTLVIYSSFLLHIVIDTCHSTGKEVSKLVVFRKGILLNKFISHQ